MLDYNTARRVLSLVNTLTLDIDGLLERWPWREDRILKDLQTYQVFNRGVYALLNDLKDAAQWNETLKNSVSSFLKTECCNEADSLLGKKLACLYAEEIPHEAWREAYRSLHEALTLILDSVSLLVCDLYAFNALPGAGYCSYRSIIDPVIYSYDKSEICIMPLGNTDTVIAVAHGNAGLKNMLELTDKLRKRILECRHQDVLPDAIQIAAAVAFGKCRFNLITERPIPDTLSSPAFTWYQAAKLQKKAEQLCKHSRKEGGFILLSDTVREVGLCHSKQINMSSIANDLPNETINILL